MLEASTTGNIDLPKLHPMICTLTPLKLAALTGTISQRTRVALTKHYTKVMQAMTALMKSSCPQFSLNVSVLHILVSKMSCLGRHMQIAANMARTDFGGTSKLLVAQCHFRSFCMCQKAQMVSK